jgi:ElaB/YqjD/DUF883 family membrane-anchored ribosome-binding protein
VNEIETSTNPTSAGMRQDPINAAAAKAKGAVRSSQRGAAASIDKAANSAEILQGAAQPVLDQAANQSANLLQQGRDKALDATDVAVTYAKDKPVKAVLIAAAAGAVAMHVLVSMARSGD